MLDGSRLSIISDRLKDFSEVRKNTGGILSVLGNTRQNSSFLPPVEERSSSVEESAKQKKASEQLESRSSEDQEDFSYTQTQHTKTISTS